jgi:hypothetical protein
MFVSYKSLLSKRCVDIQYRCIVVINTEQGISGIAVLDFVVLRKSLTMRNLGRKSRARTSARAEKNQGPVDCSGKLYPSTVC